MLTPEELIAFEKDIAEAFNRKEIRYPIHLSSGNEEPLINIFKDVKPGDWVFSTWRSHYHALLAGVPPADVKASIMLGRSMTLCWPEHNFFSSAIVSGCAPIALGVAWQIKRRGGKEKVWCFLGDMAARTGLVYECMNYASGHSLPLIFVIEDNGKSVVTDTIETWESPDTNASPPFRHYSYKLDWPHAGSGQRINF